MDGQAKELQGDMAEVAGQTFLKGFIWFVLILLYSCRCRRKGAPPQYRVGLSEPAWTGAVPVKVPRILRALSYLLYQRCFYFYF
jgi:hypothetical protein